MNTSGEAAEQVMRMSLEGAEILIKLTGSGAKNAAVLLYSIYKEQNKTRGKERLTNMLRSGKPLKVYTFKRDNLEKFKEVAKEYGILYTVLKEKEDMCFVTGEPCEWSLAIAVYAVKTNRTEDVVTFDDEKAEVLKEIYRRLNRMDVHTEQIAVKETHLETQEDGSVVPVEQESVKTYLYIETVPLTAEEAANLYKRITDTPKTTTSRRVIPIPRQILPLLREQKKKSRSTFVVGEDRLQSVRSYQYSFSLLLKKLGISHRGFHALRHTFATRALECGMDVKTLSEILGHKNPVVTLNRYAHSLMPHKHEAMNRLGKLF